MAQKRLFFSARFALVNRMKPKLPFLPALLLSFSVFLIATSSAASLDQKQIGLQLYSLRYQFATNVAGTLDEVKGWGITNVELAGTYGLTPEQFKAHLDARGLNVVSGHFPFNEFRTNLDGIIQ